MLTDVVLFHIVKMNSSSYKIGKTENEHNRPCVIGISSTDMSYKITLTCHVPLGGNSNLAIPYIGLQDIRNSFMARKIMARLFYKSILQYLTTYIFKYHLLSCKYIGIQILQWKTSNRILTWNNSHLVYCLGSDLISCSQL